MTERFGIRYLHLFHFVAGLLLCAVHSSSSAFPANMCPADRFGSNPSCSAADVPLGTLAVNNNVTSCEAGEIVTLDLSLKLELNASTRYDFGTFIALDGKDLKLTSAAGGSAQCAAIPAPLGPPPLIDLNNNDCGDAQATGVATLPLGPIQVLCAPADDGSLKINGLVSWHTNSGSQGTCHDASDLALQNGGSKCSTGTFKDIPVSVLGSVTIKKVTDPSGATQSFSYTVTPPGGAPPVASFSLTDETSKNFTTQALKSVPSTYTVTETLDPNWPVTSIECVDTATSKPITPLSVDRGAGSVSLDMSPTLSEVTCTYTNQQRNSFNVTKHVTGEKSGYVDGSTFPITVACTDTNGSLVSSVSESVADGGTITVTDLAPGVTCTASEDPNNLPAPKNGYRYGPSELVTVNTGTAVAVEIHNPLSADPGSVRVTKQVVDLTRAGYIPSSTFDITITCTDDSATPATAQTLTQSIADGGSFTLSGVPAGAHCSVSEPPDTPAARAVGYSFEQIVPAPVDMPAGGLLDFTIVNRLVPPPGSLTVTKRVTGAVAGYVAGSTFPINVDCSDGSGTAEQLADGQSTTIKDIAAGALCHITEGTPPPAASGYAYDKPILPADVTIAPGGAQTVTVENPLIANPHSLTVVKKVTGATAGYEPGSVFAITVACDNGGPTQTGAIVDGGSFTVDNIPSSATCTVTEDKGTLPAPKPGYTYGTPVLPPPVGNLLPGGLSWVEVQNPLTANPGSLTITKHVTGATPGYNLGSLFAITVACDNGGPTVTQSIADGGSFTVSAIPAGSTCTTTESAPPAPKTGYTYGNAVLPAAVTMAPGGTPSQIVLNPLRANPGSLIVTEQVIGPGYLPGSTFPITVSCSDGTVETWPFVDGESFEVRPIRAGATCYITQGELPPTSDLSYEYDIPILPAPVTTIPSEQVSVTVKNPLRQSTAELTAGVIVTGHTAGYVPGSTFPITVNCVDASNVPVTGFPRLINLVDGADQSFTSIPLGSTCSVSQGTVPATTIPAYVYGTPLIPPSVTVQTNTPVVLQIQDPITLTTGSLIVNATVTGAVAGYVPGSTFAVTVTCDNGGPTETQFIADGTYFMVAGIPVGATCVISQSTQPASQQGYDYGTVEVSTPIQILANTTVSAQVQNPLIANAGSLTVTKQVTGVLAGLRASDTFPIDVQCSDGTQAAQTLSNGASFTINAIAAGAVCTVTESAPPRAANDYGWGVPLIPHLAAMPPDGKQTLTVQNPLVFSPSGIVPAVAIIPAPLLGLSVLFVLAVLLALLAMYGLYPGIKPKPYVR
ncbi:MAG: DUF5979 domain-containing protein [Rhodanobacter sp.]|jgi:hypothetical protein|nr:DUF5979 domain-containing protein [Rhodanobacter sp.]